MIGRVRSIQPAGRMLLVTRQSARAATLCAAALLVGLAVTGCAHRGPSSTPSAATQPSGSVPAATGITSIPSASTTGTAPAVASATAAQTGQSTPAPIDSELDQINSLINDINNSMSDSDSSQQGGE